VREHTGFDFDIPPSVGETPMPDPESLALLRGDVPARIRDLYPQFTERVFGMAA